MYLTLDVVREAILVIALMLAFVAGVSASILPGFVPVLEVGDTAPPTQLRDENGRAVTLRSWPGAVLIVMFAYTRCHDSDGCPLASAKFALLQRRLPEQNIHLVEITLDPAHDSPAVLQRYGASFGAEGRRWSFLTGPASAVRELADRFGVEGVKSRGRPIIHAQDVFVIASDGRIADRITGGAWLPDEILAQASLRAGLPTDLWARTRLVLASGAGSLCSGGYSGISLGVTLAIFLSLVTGGIAFASRWLRRLFPT